MAYSPAELAEAQEKRMKNLVSHMVAQIDQQLVDQYQPGENFRVSLEDIPLPVCERIREVYLYKGWAAVVYRPEKAAHEVLVLRPDSTYRPAAATSFEKVRVLDTVDVNERHLQLLQHFCIRWNEGEAGAPGVDTKRPYGNSDYLMDMREILDNPPDGTEYEIATEDLREMHQEMESVLSILCSNLSISVGTWQLVTRGKITRWEKKVD